MAVGPGAQSQKSSPTMLTLTIVDLSRGLLRQALLVQDPSVPAPDAWWHHHDTLAARLPETELSSVAQAVREELYRGRGTVVVRLGADVPPDSVRLLQLAIGTRFGDNLTIAPDEPGRPLFRISAVEGLGRTGDYKGNAKNREAIGLHTDGSGVWPPTAILSMSCIRPAQRGGESRFADARDVRAVVSQAALRVLERAQPRESPYKDMPPEQLVVAPVFGPLPDGVFSYHPDRLRHGIQLVRGRLSREESSAFEELDSRLTESAVDFRLEAGDIVVLDNFRIAHDRRPFIDDPLAPRLLERLWIGRSRDDPRPRLDAGS